MALTIWWHFLPIQATPTANVVAYGDSLTESLRLAELSWAVMLAVSHRSMVIGLLIMLLTLIWAQGQWSQVSHHRQRIPNEIVQRLRPIERGAILKSAFILVLLASLSPWGLALASLAMAICIINQLDWTVSPSLTQQLVDTIQEGQDI